MHTVLILTSDFVLLVFTQSDIASFVKHLPFLLLILGFLFWFDPTYRKRMCKSLEILGAPRKKHRFLIGYFNLPLATHIPDKRFSFLETFGVTPTSSNIAPFMEHPVYVIFNVENILLVDFHLTLAAQIPCLKLIST